MKWVKAALKYVLLGAFLFCVGHSLYLSIPLSDAYTPVIYYLEGQGMSLSELDAMRDDEAELDDGIPFASYSRVENQTFTNPELGRNFTGPALYLYGDSSLILASSGELFSDDKDGCLLSSAAAWELFGESSVSSGKVSYMNREYLVRGIYEDENPVVIVCVPREKAAKKVTPDYDDYSDGAYVSDPETPDTVMFDRILIRPAGDTARRLETIRVFENRHGFGGSKTDCSIYVRLGIVFGMLIPVFVLVIFLWLVISSIIRLRNRPFWLAVTCIAGAAFFAAFVILFKFSPKIPADLIPNRWSDFDFWGEKIAVLISSIRHMLFAGKTEVELSYFRPLTDMTGYMIPGVILFFVCNAWFKKDLEAGSFPVIIILTCITEMIILLLLIQSGLSGVSRQILIYLWPYLLGARYIFGKNGLLGPKYVDFEK